MQVNEIHPFTGSTDLKLFSNVVLQSNKTFTVGTGLTSLGGALTVTGITTLNGNLSVSGSNTVTIGSGTLTSGGILNLTLGTGSTSTTTGTLKVAGGVGITENLFIGGTGNFSGITSCTSGIGSTNTTTGALRVTGGVGITENLFVGGTLNVSGTGLTSLGGALTVAGLTTLNGNLSVSGSNTVTIGTGTLTSGGILNLTLGTGSTNTTTGTLRVAGGAGITENVFIGGTLNVIGTGLTSLAGALTVTGITTLNGNLSVSGSNTVTIGTGTLTSGGILNLTLGTGSSSTTTGTLRVAGGVGITENLFVGGTSNVTGVGTFSNTTTNPTAVGSNTPSAAVNISGGIALTGTAKTLFFASGSSADPGAVNAVRSSGTKIVLLPNNTSTTTDYAFGVGSNTLWYQTDVTGTHKFYCGAINQLSLSGSTLANGILQSFSTTESTTTGTGSFVTAGGIGAAKNLFIGGTGNFAGITNCTSGTGSTNTTTGALRVTGGVGITENLFVGGTASFAGNTSVTSSSTFTVGTGLTSLGGPLTIAGLTTCNGNLTVTTTNTFTVGSGQSSFSGQVIMISGTSSTSTVTGALVVTGGAGISQNLFVGGTGNFAGIGNFTSGTGSTNTTTGALKVTGGVGITENLFVGGTVSCTSGTGSSSTTTGSLIVTGGIGVSQNAFIGGNVAITSTTDSGVLSGALSVSGGAYIAKTLFVGDSFGSTYSTSYFFQPVYLTSDALGIDAASDQGAILKVGSAGTIIATTDTLDNFSITQFQGSVNIDSSGSGLQITNGSTVRITGPPSIGTLSGLPNVINNLYALQVDSGAVGIGIAGDAYLSIGESGGTVNFATAGTVPKAFRVNPRTINSTSNLTVDYTQTFFGKDTISASSTRTWTGTNASTVVIDGPPSTGGAGTVTFTSFYSLLVNTGSVRIASNTSSSSTTTGSLIVTGGTGISQNLFVGGTSNVTGVGTFSNTTTNPTAVGSNTPSAALNIAGGIAITGSAKTLFFATGSNAEPAAINSARSTGTKIVLWPNTNVANSDYAFGVGSSSLWYQTDVSSAHKFYCGAINQLSISGSTLANGLLRIFSTTDSTTTGTGSIVTSGGIGAAKNLFVGGTGNFSGITSCTSGTSSTSTTTGALVVTGGLGVSQNLFIGGNLNVKPATYSGLGSTFSITTSDSTASAGYIELTTFNLAVDTNTNDYTVANTRILSTSIVLLTVRADAGTAGQLFAQVSGQSTGTSFSFRICNGTPAFTTNGTVRIHYLILN
jgi:fibronectin-binding autotransporter adhesin